MDKALIDARKKFKNQKVTLPKGGLLGQNN